MPAKQVIQALNLHIQGDTLMQFNSVFTLGPRTTKRRIKYSCNDTLPSWSAKGAFLSIVSGLKKLCNSINWGKRSVKVFYYSALFGSDKPTRSVAAWKQSAQTLLWHSTRAPHEPSRPFIFSYLLFQIVYSCASYYPSSCDYSPCLTMKKSSDRRWGLESFYYLRVTDFPCVGRESRTTVPVKQWRLRHRSN